MTDTHISERYEFRNIKQNEAEEAAEIERICFPPNEACSKKHMKDRVAGIADLFLVVIDKENGKMAGFLNGLATDEVVLKDEFFTEVGHGQVGEFPDEPYRKWSYYHCFFQKKITLKNWEYF